MAKKDTKVKAQPAGEQKPRLNKANPAAEETPAKGKKEDILAEDDDSEDEDEDWVASEGDDSEEEDSDEEEDVEEDEEESSETHDEKDDVKEKSQKPENLKPKSNKDEVNSEKKEEEEEDEKEEDEDEEDEKDIPLSELSEEDTTDVIPHQRLTINNSAAIRSALRRISFITPQTSFSEHQSLVSTLPFEVADPHDDLSRELEFYKVSQAGATRARTLLKKEGVPFSRPSDYFAEMVKNDDHMNKVKGKLVSEAASKKASAEAKRQRELKKFGKQVQVTKLQQRAKDKREMLEKVNSLKRKRNGGGTTGPAESSQLFDVALDDAIGERKGGKKPGAASKRQKKDEKFGYGGKKRLAKSGDAASSSDMSSFSAKRMKGRSNGGKEKAGAKNRPGKSRRTTMRSRS